MNWYELLINIVTLLLILWTGWACWDIHKRIGGGFSSMLLSLIAILYLASMRGATLIYPNLPSRELTLPFWVLYGLGMWRLRCTIMQASKPRWNGKERRSGKERRDGRQS